MLLKLIQSIIDGFASGCAVILDILPGSPFQGLYSLTLDSNWLGYLSWLIPIPEILALLEAWIVSVGLFYFYMVALRWIKAIE